MMSIPKTPNIPDGERTPLVADLLEIIQLLRGQVQALRDEVARLRGEKPRPKIRPSTLEKPARAAKKGKRQDPKTVARQVGLQTGIIVTMSRSASISLAIALILCACALGRIREPSKERRNASRQTTQRLGVAAGAAGGVAVIGIGVTIVLGVTAP